MTVVVLSFRRSPRAGRRADEWFHTTYQPWRRRTRRAFIKFSPILLVPFLPFVLVWPQWWMFFAGLAVGVMVTTYAWLIDSPPDWIDRKRRGRDGERRTEKALNRLERDGWRTWHDLAKGERANVDHVVAGPAGVFLLETKN